MSASISMTPMYAYSPNLIQLETNQNTVAKLIRVTHSVTAASIKMPLNEIITKLSKSKFTQH